MAKKSGKIESNTFVAGLFTEASPLNFPPNASKEEENFQLLRDGTRKRRLGFDLEPDAAYFKTIPYTSSFRTDYSTYTWDSPGGIPSLKFFVVQVGNILCIFDLGQEDLSTTGFIGEVNLPRFSDGATFSFASVNGGLVVVSGSPDIYLITYKNSVFSAEYFNILTRDVWGVECKTEPKYETDPTFRGSLEEAHYYNLTNQSWGVPRRF